MTPKRMLVALMFACAGTPALAESIAVPPYKPELGVVQTWRIEIESSLSMRIGGEIKHGSGRGGYTQRQTVMGRMPDGFSMLWQFDPPADDSLELNKSYAGTLEFYGAGQLVVATNLAGQPRYVYGVPDLIARMRDRHVQQSGFDTGGNTMEFLLLKLMANPMIVLTALSPAPELLARLQTDGGMEFTGGRAVSDMIEEAFDGVNLPVARTLAMGDIDRASRSVILTETRAFDDAAFTAASRKWIEKEKAEDSSFPRQLPDIADIQENSSRQKQTVVARISLDDGATVFAEHTIEMKVGSMESRTVVRVTRR